MGFLQICAGVILLQLSKSAKDVPDAAVFTGDLDQMRTVAEQEQPESEPKADAIRGTAAIIRRISQSRQKLEVAEVKRIHEERLKDQMEPIGENEHVEWDGLRRRRSTFREPQDGMQRRKTLHPPLGLTHFPDDTETEDHTSAHGDGTEDGGSFLGSFRRRAQSIIHRRPPGTAGSEFHNSMHPSELGDPSYKGPGTVTEEPMEMSHVYGLPSGLRRPDLDGHNSSRGPSSGQHGHPIAWADDVGQERAKSRGSLAPEPPPHTAKRQFSFHNPFHRHKHDDPLDSAAAHRPSSRIGIGSRQSSRDQNIPGLGGKTKNATEEERLGLVKGDSSAMLPIRDDTSDEDDWQLEGRTTRPTGMPTAAVPIPIREEKESDEGERWTYHDSSTPTSPELRSVLPAPKAKRRDELDGSETNIDRETRNVKDWEGRGGGGGGGGAAMSGGRGGGVAGGGAFI